MKFRGVSALGVPFPSSSPWPMSKPVVRGCRDEVSEHQRSSRLTRRSQAIEIALGLFIASSAADNENVVHPASPWTEDVQDLGKSVKLYCATSTTTWAADQAFTDQCRNVMSCDSYYACKQYKATANDGVCAGPPQDWAKVTAATPAYANCPNQCDCFHVEVESVGSGDFF